MHAAEAEPSPELAFQAWRTYDAAWLIALAPQGSAESCKDVVVYRVAHHKATVASITGPPWVDLVTQRR